MDINIKHLTDKEIASICIKYNIINQNDLQNLTRMKAIQEINKWCKFKEEKYKQRRYSSPNILSSTNVKTIYPNNNNNNQSLKRTNSEPLNINKIKSW